MQPPPLFDYPLLDCLLERIPTCAIRPSFLDRQVEMQLTFSIRPFPPGFPIEMQSTATIRPTSPILLVRSASNLHRQNILSWIAR
jgi:hypothetical protein